MHEEKLSCLYERKRHINLKNPRDAGRVSPGQTGIYRPVSQGIPVVYSRKGIKLVGWFVALPHDPHAARHLLALLRIPWSMGL